MTKYNYITLIEKSDFKNKYQAYLWSCVCDCGKKFLALPSEVKRGHVKSCGCYHAVQAAKRLKKHGLKFTVEHATWCRIKNRCYNKNSLDYKNYGGRGIIVCDRWKDNFQNFFDDMGVRPKGYSIERVDNNGNYEPSNCIWANKLIQSKNRRTSVFVKLFDKNVNVGDAAKYLGLDVGSINQRSRNTGESYQQSCDHFATKYNIAIIKSCKNTIFKTQDAIGVQ